MTNWAAQLSPVATAEVRNHIVKYELYRHRNLLDRFQEAAVDLSDKLVEGHSKRTYWEVIYYLCGCWFRSQPPTTSDVIHHVGPSKGTVISCLNHLERHGVILKTPGDLDRRERRIGFTGRFEKILSDFVFECFQEFEEQIIPALLADASTDRHIGLSRAGESEDRLRALYAAKLSHDLRVPLNTIIGFSEILTKELLGRMDPPGYRRYARDIQKAARQLLGLIDDVLDAQHVGPVPKDGDSTAAVGPNPSETTVKPDNSDR